MLVIAGLVVLALAIFLNPKEIRSASAPSAAGQSAHPPTYVLAELRERFGPRGLTI